MKNKITSINGITPIEYIIDFIFLGFITFISFKILKFFWEQGKKIYRRKQIEQLQNIYNPYDLNNTGQTQTAFANDRNNNNSLTTENQELLNNAKIVSSNINNYKQREIISDYKNYEDYLKKQKLSQEQAQPNNQNLKLEYKPLDLHKKPEIKYVKKFFKSNQPEIERRIPWTQDKIDIAQIPNNELCRKSITGMMFDCGVPAANNYLYEGTN